MAPFGRALRAVTTFLFTMTLIVGCQKGPEASRASAQAASPSPSPQPTGPAAAGAPAPRSSVTAEVAPAPAASTSAELPPPAPPGKIYLQQYGAPLPADDLAFTLQSLAYFFANEVVVLPVKALPTGAYYPPRSRYRAEKILDQMVTETPADAQVMVGLTTVDISTTKGEYEDWGILGLATVSGRECVISRFRAARGAKSDLHTRQRLAKVVVHEIGHTLGLPHCPEYGCLMEDGKGSVLTTDHELDFCASCRKAVSGRVLAASGPLPWDPPAHSSEVHSR